MGNLTARKLLGVGLLGSLILHAVAASLVPPSTHVAALIPIETISFSKIKRIEIEHRAVAASNRPLATTKVVHQPKTPASPAPNSKPKPDAHASMRPPAPPASTLQSTAQTVAKESQTAPPQPNQPTPHATASADARQVASATNRQIASGYMPFGAAEPTPVLDPGARQQLVALNIHVTIVVVVSDDGHTKSVRFDPPLDKALETQIQTLLASANWDPAYCGGGTPCEAAATIKL
jgi:hypothetical protein